VDITSPSFHANESIPPKFTCDGSSSNPELRFSGVPGSAKSLALIVFDPDVPKSIKVDGRYLHWAVWNLAPQTAAIPERDGRHQRERSDGVRPPCPPGGAPLRVSTVRARYDAAQRGLSETDLEGHVIEQAELVGRYDGGVCASRPVRCGRCADYRGRRALLRQRRPRDA
jgi:Raf kinase inhibitor-like YbhB/YbcL family protein